MWKHVLLPALLVMLVVDMFYLQYSVKLFKGYARLFQILSLAIIFEIYVFQAINVLSNNKWIGIGYIGLSLFLYGFLFYNSVSAFESSDSMKRIHKTLLIITLFIAPKLILITPLILEDLYRIMIWIIGEFSKTNNESNEFLSRRKFISITALGLAAVPFLSVLHGVVFGRYRYRVIRKTIKFKDLPEEFDNFTITQISDIHSGSFDNEEKVKYGIDLANQQKSDILVFTGDMVNNSAKEVKPWVDIFGKLTAPLGMFSVFGNHDYGGYGNMTDEEALESQKELKKMQKQMGFNFLSNQRYTFERNGKKLNIIGVENWGSDHFFPKKGNLNEATQEIQEGEFNVLLSHDPSFFDFDKEKINQKEKERINAINTRKKPDQPKRKFEEITEDSIINFRKKIHLTLSGHTHGMQFGIEIPGLIKWSPIKFRYPKWAGLYEENGRYLYVNRGFGYLAFPGRVGIWPEITVIELKKDYES